MTISEDVALIRKLAPQTALNTPAKTANENAAIMHSAYQRLRETSKGRDAIKSLMDDASVHVQCWAASRCLFLGFETAKPVLEAIRDADGKCSFEAEMVLEEFENGRLSFDY